MTPFDRWVGSEKNEVSNFGRLPLAVVLHAALAVFVGCSGNSGTTPAGGLEPPADKSLRAIQYSQAGLPVTSRAWSGSDMLRAAEVLSTMAQSDAGKLPRYKSDRSGKVFARITANENLDRCRDQSLPAAERLPDSLSHMQGANTILRLYVDALVRRKIGGSEVIELVGTQLRGSVVMVDLANELLPTLDKNDPSYAVRMEGFERMKSGLATTVAGGLTMLTEDNTYDVADRKRLIGYLQETLPRLLPHISAEAQTETLARLKSFTSDPKMSGLNPELTAFESAVRKTLESTGELP